MFKKGSKYTRKEVGWIVLPETGRPKGGSWDTGYVRIGESLLVFMNIGVPGKTNHDFDNEYDEETELIRTTQHIINSLADMELSSKKDY